MENLIAFLFDNIFIVIIIVGFLFSLLGKLRGNPGQQAPPGRTPSGQPSSDPLSPRQPRPDMRRVPSSADSGYPEPVVSRPPAEQSGPVRYPIQYDTPETPQEQRKRPEPKPAVPTVRAVQTRQQAGQQSVSRSSERDGQASRQAGVLSSQLPKLDSQEQKLDELKQAILWAEILGPPRAKRPFR
ncbi:hypothetical protein EBB07_33350 [Paenibacillaceae bacterium]|nr:hypothetical protein EBB07_33350 [Paenibacillaceae bacterium]